ncbi:MAG: hypothetical protein EHM55_09785 [Acidobacteria bacterium]|nr:MAG: hypothetical protein EHM55_09785 [Acidobacteriota bacterium]
MTHSDIPHLDDPRPLLRRIVATLAYRAAKVLRDAPPEFGSMQAAPVTRRPVEIVAHMGDLMTWALTLAQGNSAWKAGGSDDWQVEVQRFFDGLAALDADLASGGTFKGSAEGLIHGPLADALTHVGQLAMLRGMLGAPVRPESYARAEIVVGRVGLTQAAPRREFEGDASKRQNG